MLISEFAKATELPVDTIRFYISKGLLKPERSAKGGSNPYCCSARKTLPPRG